MKGYLITSNGTLWELYHSRYAKSKKFREFFEAIGCLGFFFFASVGATILPLEEGETHPLNQFSVAFFVASVVLTLISCWIIIRFRNTIRRWKGSVVIDGALHTINLYGTKAQLVSVSLVEFSQTESFPYKRLLIKTSSLDYVLLDDRFDWYNEAEWSTIGSSLATFLDVSFKINFEDVSLSS